MISIKPSADIRYLHHEVWAAVYIAEPIFKYHGVDTVITSGNDSKHSKASLHYLNYAVDLRTRHVTPDNARTITRKIKEKLGDDYDVILESNHLHIEYDPRGNRYYAV